MTAVMIPTIVIDRTSKLARVARHVGALVAVAFLFSGFSTWAFNTGALPLPPLAFMLVVLACAGAALLLEPARVGGARVKIWSAASACFAMLAFLWSSGSEVALQEAQTRTLSAMLLVGFSLLMADASTRTLTRRAIAVCTLLTVAINVWEITHPMTFSMALGRSASFYVNPNIAGAALVSGMLLAFPVVPARLREAFVLLVGAGVFLTLSRGALLCFGIVVAVLLASRMLRVKRLSLLSGGSTLLVASVMGAMMASGELSYLSGGAERFVKQRLGIGSREEFSADVSASSRSQLAMHALDMFGDRPLTGYGTGATVEWNEPESTHNIYVRHLAEYGVLGALLMPALLLLAWPRHRQRASRVYHGAAQAFVTFVALWGLFSHNVADDTFVLIGLALITALPDQHDPESVP
ncbi:O-antigen ligase family protein [Gemmatimonas groenlandica]|uniref:O-antigen ligase family protein n=1 Tax=Gemmatimonas groenlandica TaxID=2732249 RepID=A0A6M4IGZ9_9BACT|nr:O-antigen ligase family protein [Gemmatimonas groenlandica]QJR34123.1 O-antigen ligase family protein [Gemmatimonas groenlandica]